MWRITLIGRSDIEDIYIKKTKKTSDAVLVTVCVPAPTGTNCQHAVSTGLEHKARTEEDFFALAQKQQAKYGENDLIALYYRRIAVVLKWGNCCNGTTHLIMLSHDVKPSCGAIIQLSFSNKKDANEFKKDLKHNCNIS